MARPYICQEGSTPIDAVLRAATMVKILTDKIFIIALHLFYDCGFLSLKNGLTLDHNIYYIKEMYWLDY